MIKIAGGILLALFAVMVLIGVGLLVRDCLRAVGKGAVAAKRNARGIGVAFLAVAMLCGVFGIVMGIGAVIDKVTAGGRPPAPYVARYIARDFSKVPHELFHAPEGYEHPSAMGYYNGDRFICVNGCG